MENQDTRSLVNATGNIKRAIDSQTDMLLFAYGFLDMAKDQRWNFDKKNKLLSEIGIKT